MMVIFVSLLKLREKVSIAMGLLVGLQVLLVPTFGPRGGVVLEADGNLGVPGALVPAHPLNLVLRIKNLI